MSFATKASSSPDSRFITDSTGNIPYKRQTIQCPFLNCAAEIRNQIYNEVFDDPTFAEQYMAITKTCLQIYRETSIIAKEVGARIPVHILVLEPELVLTVQCRIPKAPSPAVPEMPPTTNRPVFDPWAERDHIKCKAVWWDFGSRRRRILANLSDISHLDEIKIEISAQWGFSVLGNRVPLEEFFFSIRKTLSARILAPRVVVQVPRIFTTECIKAFILSMKPLIALDRKAVIMSTHPLWTQHLHYYQTGPRETLSASVEVRKQYDYHGLEKEAQNRILAGSHNWNKACGSRSRV